MLQGATAARLDTGWVQVGSFKRGSILEADRLNGAS